MQSFLFTEEFCQPEKLFPFTLIRPIQDIRCGLLSFREKWELMLGLRSFDRWTDDYKVSDRSMRLDQQTPAGNYLLVHSNVHPTSKIIKRVRKLKPGQYLTHPVEGGIAFCFSKEQIIDKNRIKVSDSVVFEEDVITLHYPWQICQQNVEAIRSDIKLLTESRKSAPIPEWVQTSSSKNIFIEKTAKVEHAILNADDGPIYIGKDALIMDGASIRGPFACGESAVVKMGARIYGGTSLGPFSTAGGEIKNSVLMGYCNKAHDGYLGDAVIGTWCNLGAGTTCSNLKNNAGSVRVYSPASDNQYQDVGLKCGVLMGDYSRSAINTSFNTGTVVGVSANVFGRGLTPKFIPNFSWGDDGIQKYQIEKALEDIGNWKKLKGLVLGENEKDILKYIYGNL